MLTQMFGAVFDDSQNDLGALTKPARFQIMVVLSWMWSTIFSAAVGSYLVFGTTMIAHMLVLLGAFLTIEVFRRSKEARRSGAAAG